MSRVARRFEVNANLIVTWLRDPRFALEAEAPSFLPVEVVAVDPGPPPEERREPDGRIEVALAGGVRLRVVAATNPRCWRG